MSKFVVLVGMNYGSKRREPGDVADDIPTQSVSWLLEQGAIKPLEVSSEAEG